MTKPEPHSPALCPALDNLPAPVLLIDHSFTLAGVNRAAQNLVNRKAGDNRSCFALLHTLRQPCRVPLTECPVRFFQETGEPLVVTGSCCRGRLVSSFDAGDGLVGLLIDARPTLNRDDQLMIHTGKMAALGSMLAHIVHNMNSSFYVITNYLGALAKKLENQPTNAELRQTLERIGEANRMTAGMAKTLLDYLRPQNSGQQVSPREAAREILSLLSGALDAAGITTEVTGGEDGFELDRQPLLTVFFNVIQNAVEAMPAGGELRIDITPPTITVTDRGCGIARENLPRIFDPYFTTSATGTGLGLFIAQRMMHSLNGEILVTSRIGAGTTVKLVFHDQ